MDLSLTEEQEMLKAAVRRFVDTEYPKETLLELSATGQSAPSEPWSKLASTGWLGIIIPTEYGGEGGSFTDAGVLFEELGRGPVPGPHLSSAALGALAILEAGTEEQKRSLLPDIAAGRRTVALAITEADYQWDESDVQAIAATDGDGFRISGTKVYVYDAAAATDLICAVRTENRQHVGLVVIPADAPGVSVRKLEGFAWNLAEVRLDGVQVGQSAVLSGRAMPGFQPVLGWLAGIGAGGGGGHSAVVRIPGWRFAAGVRDVGRLQPHADPVRHTHWEISKGTGPHNQPGQRARLGAVDDLRSVVEVRL